MNWFKKLAYELRDEVFIDDSGFVYGADGDIGSSDHDSTVMETVLSCLDDFEELEIMDVMDLSEEQMQEVDNNYPGFVEYVVEGGLPKEYAVLKMGWIRVLGSSFEIGELSEEILNRIANYAYEETGGNGDVKITISERASNQMEEFTLGELMEALAAGSGVARFRMKARRPGGLY